MLKNEGSKPHVVHPRDKIALMSIDLCLQPAVMKVQEMNNTDRCSKGCRSTDASRTVSPPPMLVSSVSSVNPVISCADNAPLIHPHCPPAVSWHNQFMPPLFLYFLYILSGRKKQKQATSAMNSREGPGRGVRLQRKRESTGISLGVGSAGRILIAENSSAESKTSSVKRLWPAMDDVVVALLAFSCR